jgi:Holliday junction resolvasome RuvABC endonuclease subunit
MGLDMGEVNIGVSILIANPLHSSKPFKILYKKTLIYRQETLPEKCFAVYESVDFLLREYKPSHLWAERTIMPSKTGSAMDALLGSIFVAAKQHNVQSDVVRPNQVKRLVTGKGNADKKEVVQGLAKWIKQLPKFETDHESDAVAVAIAGMLKANLLPLIKAAD